jgi:hypothetical protein
MSPVAREVERDRLRFAVAARAFVMCHDYGQIATDLNLPDELEARRLLAEWTDLHRPQRLN